MCLMAGNFPVDSCDVNKEAMTQLLVGITEMIHRGRLSLTWQQKTAASRADPLLRLDRRARVSATVSLTWLRVVDSGE